MMVKSYHHLNDFLCNLSIIINTIIHIYWKNWDGLILASRIVVFRGPLIILEHDIGYNLTYIHLL